MASQMWDVRVWTGIGLGQDRSKQQILVTTLLKQNPQKAWSVLTNGTANSCIELVSNLKIIALSIAKTSHLVLFRKITAAYAEDQKKHEYSIFTIRYE
jgi:hypothetical protein